MARARWKIAAFATVLIAMGSGILWYFESPAWTLKGMRDAAQSDDAEALNEYIDYPALRESLKAELTTEMGSEIRKDQSGLGALEVAIGSAMAGPMIDRLVSPVGMRAALFANRQANMGRAASVLHVPEQPVIVRRSFSEFLVTAKDHPNRGLVFKRHGLSWLLSGVRLPPDG